MTRLVFDPALPVWGLALVAGLALLVAALAFWRGLRGWPWRGLALALMAAALSGPALEQAARQPLRDIVILAEDRSASQRLPGRAAQMDAAVAAITQALPEADLRRVTVGDDPDGTLLGTAIAQAVAAEPSARLAGVIAVSDGRLHDAGALPQTLPAPFHLLLTGQPGDWDRRLVVDEAPGFGLIGQPVTLRLRIQDQGAVPPALAGQPVTLSVTVDGGPARQVQALPGQPLALRVTPDHGGPNVVAIQMTVPQASPPQLTARNDAAAITIQGVRDRLRVLLVSGQPHAGERTWRNLLKSDPAVDLIHFTILRPPDRGDGVPVDEMALIPFPVDDLFMQRIDDFDLIIFDRYRVRGILPPDYFDRITRYVREGGAVLVAGGPEMATVEGLNLSPLGAILPAQPSGQVVDAPFRPALTAAGRRHPVTAGLPGAGAPDQPASWGRWLRRVAVTARAGAQVVMSDGAGAALLILSRAGKGRVAMLASDQVWLWDRGFEGGGPQLELLRRIAHWSMQEPELEEEALSLDTPGDGLVLRVTRRTLADHAGPVTITAPDGSTRHLRLARVAEGRFQADWTAPAPGLYRLRQGDLDRVVVLGPAAPREYAQTLADGAAMAPLAQATGGAVLALSEGMPQIRQVAPGRRAHGRGVGGDWIAITPRDAARQGATGRRPLLPDGLWLLLIAGAALAGWLAEGRGRAVRWRGHGGR